MLKKNKMIKIMSSLTLLSGSLLVPLTKAGNYVDPEISETSAALKSTKKIAPNIFLMLDDSGSMSFDNTMTFDPNSTYLIPPDPDKFNSQTGDFEPFNLPSGNKNGFQENNYSFTNAYEQYDPEACIPSSYSDAITQNNCKIFRAFYSTRMLALKSSLAIALTNEAGSYYLDYDFINSNFDSIELANMARDSAADFQTNMSAFLKKLYAVRSTGSTPIRSEVKKLFDKISAAANSQDNTNIFLSPIGTNYDEDELLSCKQNYNIILSDGEYNGALGENFHNRNDYDSKDFSATWQKLASSTNSLSSTIDTLVTFKGDGSIKEQRLFAGGNGSLHQEIKYIYQGSINDFNDPRILKKSDGTPDCPLMLAGDGRYYNFCKYASNTSTLSDIIFNAWSQDLSASLDNNVKPQITVQGDKELIASNGQLVTLPEVWNPANDPANWQRIISYTIGLNIGQEWTEQQMADVINGSSLWTTNYSNGTHLWKRDAVTDFVRSGYVGRGGFRRVDTAEDLVETFSEIFSDAIQKSGTNSASGTAASTSQITTQSAGIIFSSELDMGLRTGNLKGTWMYNGLVDNPATTGVDEGQSNGGVAFCYGQDTPPAGAFAGQLCTAPSARWSAINEMPAWDDRKIFSYNPTTQGGIPFAFNQMDNTQKSHINALFSPSKISTVSDRSAIINFLKGDNSLVSDTHNDIIKRPDGEGPNSTPLGDFGRGGPVFLGSPNTTIWGGNLTEAEKDRAVAFAGANDGMLHAFDAITGIELFAYVPNAVYKNFSSLVLPNQPHTAFVDGKMVVKDIDNKKTLLVSGMGAGAKGLFALDVTQPRNFSQNDVLWEIDETTEPRIGRIFGKPSIIRVEGEYQGEADRWVVVVGTGYNNNNKYINDEGTLVTNADSGILVIDALTGDVLDFLKLPSAQGVGEILWVDHQKQKDTQTFSTYYSSDNYWGEMDRGYVGDLTGNVWVLDFAYDSGSATAGTELKSAIIAGGDNDLGDLDSEILSPVPSSSISNGEPAPLFIATDENGNRQPITTGMTVQPHPSNRGYMVYFGTGELFQRTPFQPTTSNSMYGIWDDIGDNYGDIATANVLDNNLTRNRFYLTFYPWETVTARFSGGGSAYARVPSSGRAPMQWANFQGNPDSASEDVDNPVDKTQPASGWVVNTGKSLENQYERVFQPPYSVINEFNEEGITFSMSTLEENTDPCINSSGAYTWNMTFRTDVIDGPFAAFSGSQSDTNRDGTITADDMVSYNGSTGVALGALPSTGGMSQSGVPSLEYNPTVIQSPRGSIISPLGAGGANNFCPTGTARSYKKALSSENQDEQIVEEINICIPSTMSSWSEIE